MKLSRETRNHLWRDLLVRSSDPYLQSPGLLEQLLRYAVTLTLIVLALYLFAQL